MMRTTGIPLRGSARTYLALCLAAALAGCFKSTLWDVANDPAAFRHQVVTVTGEVAGQQTIPGVAWSFYQLSDGHVGVWVMADGEPPPIDSTHTVTGRVETGISLRGASFNVLIDATLAPSPAPA